MIFISFIHITDGERNITLNFEKVVRISTQITGTAITLELRTVQQLQ